MTSAKPMIALSAATIAVITMASQGSLADGTNGATTGTIDLQFQNAPAFTLIEWVTRLTDEPVVVPYNVNFPVTYRTEHKLTRDEAIAAIDGVLRTNAYCLVRPDGSYYRVAKVSETNSIANRSHIDLEVQGDKVVVNGNTTVDLKDLASTLAALSTPETEIWIRHLVAGWSRGRTSNEAMELLTSLRGWDANKMFLKYVPEAR
jgi:hypothetical protein